MSGNNTVNAGISLAVGIGVGFATAGIGTALISGITAGTKSLLFSSGFLASTLLFNALTQDNSGSQKKLAASQLNFPVASEGISLPVVFGTAKLPLIISSYKNFFAEKIEADTGGGSGSFGSQSQVVGFKYYLDVCYTICLLEIDYFDGLEITKGRRIHNGGLSNDGSGGFETLTTNRGVMRLYWGSNHPVNPLFLSFDNDPPLFNHICYISTRGNGKKDGFLMGGSSNLPPVYCIVERYPKTGLEDGGTPIASKSANPASIVYEILTNPILNPSAISPDLIDSESFESAIQLFLNEGLGLSFTLNQSVTARQVIDDISSWAGLFLYRNQEGKIAIGVKRENTDTSSAIVLTDREMIGDSLEVSTSTFNDIVSSITVSWTDFANSEFIPRTTTIFNQALIQSLGRNNNRQVNLGGIIDNDVAFKVGTRILHESSSPMRVGRVQVNRSTVRPWIADRIIIRPNNWPESQHFLAMITEIEEQEEESDIVTIQFVEDRLAEIPALVSSDPDDVIAPDFLTLRQIDRAKIYELPWSCDTDNILFIFPASQLNNDRSIGFNIWARETGSGSEYVRVGTVNHYVPTARLLNTLSATSTAIDATAEICIQTDGVNDDLFDSVSTTLWSADYELILIDRELISIKTITADENCHSTNGYKITGLRRGAKSSQQASHSINSPVFFVRTILDKAIKISYLDPTKTYDIKLQPYDSDGEGRELSVIVPFTYNSELTCSSSSSSQSSISSSSSSSAGGNVSTYMDTNSDVGNNFTLNSGATVTECISADISGNIVREPTSVTAPHSQKSISGGSGSTCFVDMESVSLPADHSAKTIKLWVWAVTGGVPLWGDVRVDSGWLGATQILSAGAPVGWYSISWSNPTGWSEAQVNTIQIMLKGGGNIQVGYIEIISSE